MRYADTGIQALTSTDTGAQAARKAESRNVAPRWQLAKKLALYVLKIVAIAAVYAAFAALWHDAPWANPTGIPIWPPSGLALSILLLAGNSLWPAIAVGACLSCIMSGQAVLVSALSVMGAVTAGLIGSLAARRWARGWNAFQSPAGVLKFTAFAVVPASAVAAASAVAGVAAADPAFNAFGSTWLVWWFADLSGSLLLAPLVILWARPVSRAVAAESALAAALSLVIGFAAFSPVADVLTGNGFAGLHRPLLGFLMLGLLTWAMLRNDQRIAATSVLAFVDAAALGVKPVWGAGDRIGDPIVLLLALSISVALASLVVTAAFASRRDAYARLAAARDRLNTELQQTVTALERAKHHFQALVDDVADHAVFVLDTAGRVASWNNSAQRITGHVQEEVLGKPFGIFYRPDERRSGEAVRALELAIQKGKHELEGWRIRKDGTPFFVTGVVSVIRNAKGDLIGFSSIMRDTTERRDTQEKLVEAREQLAMAQKMEAIGKLTGGIAHDFNNLLMIIGGNAQTFKRLLDPKLPRAIEAIQTAAKRGETLTRQLLTFSRSQHLSPSVINIAAVVRNMRPMIESSLRGNIVYKEDVVPGTILTKVDLAELELAIVNIAVNARDAMPHGGTFTLSLAPVNEPQDAQGNRLEGGFASISFGDTGAGIPPNLLSKIFDPFFTTKEVGKGTGLGLSQVYGFVHQAGGTIKVDSRVGEGTTFTVYLPLCSEQETAVSATTARVEPPRPCVLVVDDNPDVAQVTSSLFEQMGYDTSLRDSAESALQFLAQGKRTDLVFSDIVMPGSIDGIGLAKEIRVRYPGLPVVLSTGYTDSAQKVPDGLQVLRKPFDTDALSRVVESVLGLGEPAQMHH